MSQAYIKRIDTARVYEVANRTPLQAAPLASQRIGQSVFIKREDLQPVHSFKIRGAYNKISQLSESELKRGIIAASAGNHAQGVALAAQRSGVKATIVMPKTTPQIKVDAVRRRGAKIVLHGDSYDDASTHALQMAEAKGLTYVHPYDDPEVIAGQGTVGKEILEQMDGSVDAVFVPVGGGGFIAGIAVYIKSTSPKTRIIGVEPEDAACLQAALQANKRVVLDQVGLFADGVAVRQIGKETFRLAKKWVDEVITVTVDEICAATSDIFAENRSLPEPAGALGLAGLKKWAARQKTGGKQLVAIESGANVTFERLRHIAERAELGEQHEALLGVTIPEEPGSFKRFCNELGKRGITEFNYRYAHEREAHVFVGVKLSGEKGERTDLIKRLRAKGYSVADLSDDEMAKVHVRYMVGGRADDAVNERLFRFQFPERPGALLNFLKQVGARWNISLFHYRNHGSAYGRVLVGMQVPEAEIEACTHSFDELGYPWWREDDSPAYRLFLRGDTD